MTLKRRSANINLTNSIISLGSKIIGSIDTNEDLIIKGLIVGDIKTTEKLTLSNSASIEGSVSVGNLHIESGSIIGEVNCIGKVEILDNSYIKGNVNVESASISGKIEGNIKASQMIYLSESSIVNGDIEASSVQVETGARITGQLIIKG